MIVYLVRNKKSGKSYVGKTKRTLEQRWREHVRNAKIGHTSMGLYFAIRKHGEEAFQLHVLAECTDEGALDLAERHWIAFLDTYRNGYNLTQGGDGLRGYKHTDATKKRMSEYRRGRPMPEGFSEKQSLRQLGVPKPSVSKHHIGEGNPMFGKHHCEEARKKISQALRNRVRSTRSVIQYDMIGTMVATYPSLKTASDAVNGHKARIGDCCRGNRETHAGFKWSYADNIQVAKE